ncbi:hypothetical protein [Saccharomonospora iraqiensis]|uniref:hypothetical protein n=1 Tax=Saccharomonospora iraqiensis TaxID=52698 RepID=UPI00022E008D|nr:hypothetical protein [Saccharomonospora iraqiensis]
MSDQSTTPCRPGRMLCRSVLSPVVFWLIGAATGVFAAYSYYHDPLDPFAHSLTVWIALAVVASARTDTRTAIVRTVGGLVGAVVLFYVGKPVFYGRYYPDVPPIGVNTGDLVLWCVLAVCAGVALGPVFSHIDGDTWWAAVATAVALTLLWASTLVEVGPRLAGEEFPLISFTVLATGAVFLLARTRKTQLVRILCLVAPVFVVSLGVVLAPDVLEELLLRLALSGR